jgi:hypothetical protein
LEERRTKIVERLAEFCEQQRPVTLTLGNWGTILQGRFSEVASDEFVVEVLSLPKQLNVTPAAQCTVIFNDDNRTNVLVCSVRELRSPERAWPQLVLSHPTKVIYGESRRSFRVPVHPDTDLRVRVKFQDREWYPRPLDVSLGGALLQFPKDDLPDFEPDARLIVLLEIFGNTTELEAFLGRARGTCYAVYFPEALRELRSGITKPPHSLRAVVDALEREWLAWQVAP